MTKDIKTVISKYYPKIQLNIDLINSNTLDKMFPFQNKIPYLCCFCVIYKYQCDQYRIFQHKGVSCRTGNRLTCLPIVIFVNIPLILITPSNLKTLNL